LAAACIVLVRAFTVHIGFFLHARLQQSGVLAPESVVSTLATVVLIMSIYSIVIALFKDLPDISGDKLHGINTVSVRFGVRRYHKIYRSLSIKPGAVHLPHMFCVIATRSLLWYDSWSILWDDHRALCPGTRAPLGNVCHRGESTECR
jgi:homogentisate phytyltransferase/homogentisate geranylgeranyltransferase